MNVPNHQHNSGKPTKRRLKPQALRAAKARRKAFLLSLKTMNAINIIAISDKGKSRIGKKLTLAIVEQDHHDKMFIVIPGTNQCRWIKKDCDPDFRIIEND